MNWYSILNNTVQALVGINAVYFALAAIGLNVQFGFAGLLNFGQAGFMACGAYGLGMTSHYFGVSFWWGLVFGLAYTVGLALLLGIPTLRLRADYLAIVTIAAAEIVRLVVRSRRFTWLFAGSDGIQDFSGPYRDIGRDVFEPAEPWRFPLFGRIRFGNGEGRFDPFVFSGRTMWTLLIGWILVGLCGLFVYLLMRSPWGRVIKGIREDETAVVSLGKNVYAYKMSALIIGGIMGMLSGMIFALDRGSVQPDNYSRDVTFYILTALVLGGMASVTGSIVGPMVFWALFSFTDGVLRDLTDDGPLKIFGMQLMSSTEVGPTRLMLIGVLLMVLMVFRPQGLFGNKKEMSFDVRH
jgi:branched-chain amino acid transport system permease protein